MKRLFIAVMLPAIFLVAFPKASFSQTSVSETMLFLDPSQPTGIRVNDLISRLTLEERAILLNHRGPDVTRFNIKSDKWNQSLHGVWWNRPTTMFPTSIAMGATWDPALIYEEATAISDEARAIYNWWHTDSANFQGERKGLIYRSPVINVSRNPYWGRINETIAKIPLRRLAGHVKGCGECLL